uniref:Uncharacterized protein n=1 Tax=Serinus canaria TaxID=9135 RepID=A0A8C9MGC6_SERCA
MPAGAPWPTYLRALAASMLAMFAGAEVVHRYYRPDLVSARRVPSSTSFISNAIFEHPISSFSGLLEIPNSKSYFN